MNTLISLASAGKTLYTFAHPDDECLLPGTIARIADVGEQLAFYATRGEGGKTAGLCEPESLGDVRAKELEMATRQLGIQRLFTHDLGDGHLPSKEDELIRTLVQLLEQTRPSLVITMPPSGITEHPDHMTVQRATLAAVKMVKATFPVSLYYRVIPVGSEGIVGIQHDERYPPSHRIDVSAYQTQMWQCLRAHRTQKNSMGTIFPALDKDNPKLLWREEMFTHIL